MFMSPNRFSVLATDENLLAVFSSPSAPVASEANCKIIATETNYIDVDVDEFAKKPSTPIVISNVTNYSALKAVFTSLVGTDDFTVTAKGASLYVKTRNCIDHFKLIDYCNDQYLKAHTWAPRHTRPIKVFIHHLHHTIAIEDIERALTDEEFSVINVSNIRHRLSKQALSLFSVILITNEFNRRIYQLFSLLNSKIAVEKLHRARFPPLCKQYQRYVQTQEYCNEPPRCVKCSNNHLTNACTKPSSKPAKFALCAEAHTANYKGCSSLKKKVNHLSQESPYEDHSIYTTNHAIKGLASQRHASARPHSTQRKTAPRRCKNNCRQFE
jgi:hypothetical protein